MLESPVFRVKTMSVESKKLAEKHPELTLSENRKVESHVQREDGDWIQNTVMLEDCEVPFKYRRKKKYKTLKGARVNLSYYPEKTEIGSLEFEYMKVVSIKRS